METEKIMTPEEFAEKMQEIVNTYADNPETQHREMDELMIEMLRQLGYEKGASIRDETGGWYA